MPVCWDDTELNAWLNECRIHNKQVTLLHANHRCAVYCDDAGALVHPCDPEIGSLATLASLAKAGRLTGLQVPIGVFQSTSTVAPGWASLAWSMTSKDLTAWKKHRQDLLGKGRGKDLSSTNAKLVWHDAGGRCMFRGCGKDLGRTLLTTKTAAAAYLAHIVASDPDGPRGDQQTSMKLSDDPENVMLMCDEHHRLIDRIDEDGHQPPLLRQMRSEHVAMVRHALNGLAFRRAQGIALLADLANVKTSSGERDMRLAMLERKLAPMQSIEYPARRTQRDDRVDPGFWRNLLHEHELDLRELVRHLGAGQNLGECEALAVFPVHLVPLLVLWGRVIGEARPVEVFQFHRHRATWRWDQLAITKATSAFFLESSSEAPASEVLLTIELTATVDMNALPPQLAARIARKELEWVRIRAHVPNDACIAHPEDLEQFTLVARDAIRLVQDRMRASRVHLIGISPASTLFRLGQLLQAGHHCPYTVYDRANFSMPFSSALTITGSHVEDATQLDDAGRKIIQLR